MELYTKNNGREDDRMNEKEIKELKQKIVKEESDLKSCMENYDLSSYRVFQLRMTIIEDYEKIFSELGGQLDDAEVNKDSYKKIVKDAIKNNRVFDSYDSVDDTNEKLKIIDGQLKLLHYASKMDSKNTTNIWLQFFKEGKSYEDAEKALKEKKQRLTNQMMRDHRREENKYGGVYTSEEWKEKYGSKKTIGDDDD